MIKKLFFVAFIFISAQVLAQTPLLKNFRIENSNKSRVYFDSNIPLSGSSSTGFTISGKTITGITISAEQLSGHYFTVSAPFTFWDNNTVRYRGGSDLGIYNIDMEYIKNNIPEPSSTVNRFVTTSANGSGDGTTESNAWTLSQAASQATAGQTVWIKAGNYGNSSLSVSRSGNANAPIKFIGYQNSIGDNPDLNWNHPIKTNNDSNIMPLLNGNGSGTGIKISGNYLIFRNIQATKFDDIVSGGGSDFVILDNIIASYSGSKASCFTWTSDSATNVRIINSVGYNGGTQILQYYGDFGLIDNCTLINDASGNDYYLVARGSNNIFRNTYIERFKGHTGHGISLKSVGRKTEYNLVENLQIGGIKSSIEARHDEVKYNVYRNIYVFDNGIGAEIGGIHPTNGSSFNIFDKIVVEVTDYGIRAEGSSEDPTAVDVGHDNIVKNSIFYSPFTTPTTGAVGIFLYRDSDGQNREWHNNTIINCNFYNLDVFIDVSTLANRNNHIINCNIVNVRKTEASGSDFTNSNFYNNNFSAPSGNNIKKLNPLFVNAANHDFHLQSSSPIKDAGTNSNLVRFGFDGFERNDGSFSIGAYEDATPTTGSVSPDVSICSGENTILTASGGTAYSWSTGETTASIMVSPVTSTTYSVTVTNGSDSDSHDVTVTVNQPPSVNAGSDQTICSGENITLTANGVGNFLWSTGETTSSITVSPNSTTTYTVTASNSCTDDATDQVIVNVTPGVNLTLGSDIDICLGESITLSAQSNGDFLWNTGETTASITVSPASTTIYSVTSSLGDCSKTEEVSVTVNQAPSVNAGSDQTICSGESITLTANGVGNFSWSTGETTSSITVSPTSTTTYTVTASNSCAEDATDQLLVMVNDKPIITISEDVTIESGSSTVLTATGDGNFLWSTGETTSSITVSPITTSTYNVSLTSPQGCSDEGNIVVTVQNSGSLVTADAGADIETCLDANITLTATGGDSYLWSTGETTPNIIVSPTETTTYTVTVSNGNIIDADDVTVFVDEGCSDLANRSIIQEFKVYPNPTDGMLNIELSGFTNDLILSLYDSNANIIYSKNITNTSPEKDLKRHLNLRKFSSGIYYVHVINNGNVHSKKIILN